MKVDESVKVYQNPKVAQSVKADQHRRWIRVDQRMKVRQRRSKYEGRPK